MESGRSRAGMSVSQSGRQSSKGVRRGSRKHELEAVLLSVLAESTNYAVGRYLARTGLLWDRSGSLPPSRARVRHRTSQVVLETNASHSGGDRAGLAPDCVLPVVGTKQMTNHAPAARYSWEAPPATTRRRTAARRDSKR